MSQPHITTLNLPSPTGGRVSTLVHLLCLFIPIPLFIDIKGGALYLQHTPTTVTGAIAIPIGVFSLIAIFFASHLSKIRGNHAYYTLLTFSDLFKLLVCVFPFFLFYTTYIAGLSFPRAFQLALPILLVGLIGIPNSESDQRKFVTYSITGACIFYTAHVFSLLSLHESIEEVSERAYAEIFNIPIYQALVTYPATASVYFFVAIFTLTKSHLLKINKAIPFLIIITTPLILIACGRRAALIECVGGLSIISISVSYIAVRAKANTLGYFLTVVSTILFIASIFFLFSESYTFTRAERSFEKGNFDSGRLEIYSHAFDYFYNNPKTLVFGEGGTGAVGFHNFFLDSLYRIGLLGLGILAIGLLYPTRSILRQSSYLKNDPISFTMLLVLSYLLAVQTTVNTSVAQPYYAVNILTAFLVAAIIVKLSKPKTYKTSL